MRRCRSNRGRRSAANARFSRSVICGNSGVVLEHVTAVAFLRRKKRRWRRQTECRRPADAAFVGLTNPAMQSSASVLPAPLGPNSTVMPAVAESSTSSVKPAESGWRGNVFLRRAFNMCVRRPPRAQAIRQRQDGKGHQRNHQHHNARGRAVAGFHRVIDRDGQGLRLPGILPATISVTPKSPSERAKASAVAASIERPARGNLREKKFQFRRANIAGRAFVIAVDAFERRARRFHQQRKRVQ